MAYVSASAAAGLPAPVAPLPLFPSNAKLVERAEYRELRLALLQLVEQEEAHLNASKWAAVVASLWSSEPNSLTPRFAQWEPRLEPVRSLRFGAFGMVGDGQCR